MYLNRYYCVLNQRLEGIAIKKKKTVAEIQIAMRRLDMRISSTDRTIRDSAIASKVMLRAELAALIAAQTEAE